MLSNQTITIPKCWHAKKAKLGCPGRDIILSFNFWLNLPLIMAPDLWQYIRNYICVIWSFLISPELQHTWAKSTVDRTEYAPNCSGTFTLAFKCILMTYKSKLHANRLLGCQCDRKQINFRACKFLIPRNKKYFGHLECQSRPGGLAYTFILFQTLTLSGSLYQTQFGT